MELPVGPAMLAIGMGFVVAAAVLWWFQSTAGNDELSGRQMSPSPSSSLMPPDRKKPGKAVAGKRKLQGKNVKQLQTETHRLHASTLKGHTGRITACVFSPDGRYLASGGDDRTIRLWSTKRLLEKGAIAKYGSTEFETPTALSFSPDCKAMAVAVGPSHGVRLYKIDPKAKSPIELKQAYPGSGEMGHSVVGCGLSVANPLTRTGCTYVAAALANTDVYWWNQSGDKLQSTDTKMIRNTAAATCPSGRLFAVGSAMGTVRLYEAKSKGSAFTEAKKIQDLVGHAGEVTSISFSDCSRAVSSAATGGTWYVHDVDMEFQRGADARDLGHGRFQKPAPGVEPKCALSPDLKIVAIGSGAAIWLFSVAGGEPLEMIDSAHPNGAVSALHFSETGRLLASAGGADRRINIWHNAPGLKIMLSNKQLLLERSSAGSTQTRIKKDIAEIEAQLARIASVS